MHSSSVLWCCHRDEFACLRPKEDVLACFTKASRPLLSLEGPQLTFWGNGGTHFIVQLLWDLPRGEPEQPHWPGGLEIVPVPWPRGALQPLTQMVSSVLDTCPLHQRPREPEAGKTHSETEKLTTAGSKPFPTELFGEEEGGQKETDKHGGGWEGRWDSCLHSLPCKPRKPLSRVGLHPVTTSAPNRENRKRLQTFFMGSRRWRSTLTHPRKATLVPWLCLRKNKGAWGMVGEGFQTS